MRNNVDYVKTLGIELEGGWNCRCGDHRTRCGCAADCLCAPEPLSELPSCIELFSQADPHCDSSVGTDAQWNGEISCGAFAVHDPWRERLQSIWPDEVDETCGMHIHMGLHSDDVYARFMAPAFETHLIVGLTKWGNANHITDATFWSRLAGENSFCLRGFFGDLQANESGKSMERYRVCNYTWRHKGTLEVRVLPMFDESAVGLKAIEEVVRLTNDWARTHRARQHTTAVCVWDDAMMSARNGIESSTVEVIEFDHASTSTTEDLFTCV